MWRSQRNGPSRIRSVHPQHLAKDKAAETGVDIHDTYHADLKSDEYLHTYYTMQVGNRIL